MITKVRMLAPEIGMRSAVKDQPQERRRYQRQPASLEVELEFAGRRLRARTRDLSLGGLSLDVVEPIPHGQEVSLSFVLPTDPQAIRCHAVARWADPQGGLGLQFLGLRARATWAVQKFLMELSLHE